MVQNLKQLMKDFSDEQHCINFLIRQRWDGCPKCPYCGSEKWYKIENGKRFKCGNKECYKKYSVTVGTVFHASNIPLTTWFPALYLVTAHKKGISSIQLAKDLGTTQKTAWFMILPNFLAIIFYILIINIIYVAKSLSNLFSWIY